MPISSVVPRILLANPDEIFARSLESILSSAGYAVLWAPTAVNALEQEHRARPDAAILAMDLADEGGGLALCRTLRRERGLSPSTPIFLPTNRSDAAPAHRGLARRRRRAVGPADGSGGVSPPPRGPAPREVGSGSGARGGTAGRSQPAVERPRPAPSRRGAPGGDDPRPLGDRRRRRGH